MKNLVIAAIFALGISSGLNTSAQAGSPVVVELYTSQGCSSCPPADALLQQIALRDDVIALALHVDYWDYIGWADTFANPAYTQRQRHYAQAANKRMIYTPQMIIQGATHVVGHDPTALEAALTAHAAENSGVRLEISRENGRLSIRSQSTRPAQVPAQVPAQMIVQLARYTPVSEVAIRRGENAGRTLSYAHVVTHLETLRQWDGREDLVMSTPISGAAPVVVLIQEAGYGSILAAARLR